MNECQEEILEAIWNSAEKKEYSMGSVKNTCSIPFTDEELKELEKEGLIVESGDKILFSSKGKSYAEKIIRRHRLAKVLVHSILKLKDSKMEEIACNVEHTLLPEVEEAICTLLGHPEVSPDGKSIPRGECCGREATTVDTVIMRLSELKAGEKGKVMFIKPGSHSQLHQLLSFGLTPGTIVTVHRVVPAFCIKLEENTDLALDMEIVKNIFVLKVKPSVR